MYVKSGSKEKPTLSYYPLFSYVCLGIYICVCVEWTLSMDRQTTQNHTATVVNNMEAPDQMFLLTANKIKKLNSVNMPHNNKCMSHITKWNDNKMFMLIIGCE